MPSYYDPIIQEGIKLSGMTPSDYYSLTSGYSQAQGISPFGSTGTNQYGPMNPKPIGRPEQLNAANVANRNIYEKKVNGVAPFFRQAMQRAQIRDMEDMRKYQRDYRQRQTGNRSINGQNISGTLARMQGKSATEFSPSTSSSGRFGTGDPVVQGFETLARPVF